MDMEVEITEPGNITYYLTVKKEHLATPTAMHGGAMSGFMDAIIGVAALSVVAKENKLVSTIEFKINFLKPAYLNDQLKGIGKVIKKGNRIIIARGDVYNQHEELIATATGTLNAYPFDKSDLTIM